MRIIENNVQSEVNIKKSKFIALLFKIEKAEDVKNILKKVKEEHFKAKHHCYAYIIDDKKISSDDKEPVGTAGIPILSVLENNDLNYTLCIIVRYFGGILLGKSGLNKAYKSAAKLAVDKAEVKEVTLGYKIVITFELKNLKLINNYLKNINITNKLIDNVCEYELIGDNVFLEKLKKDSENLNIKIINIKKDLI